MWSLIDLHHPDVFERQALELRQFSCADHTSIDDVTTVQIQMSEECDQPGRLTHQQLECGVRPPHDSRVCVTYIILTKILHNTLTAHTTMVRTIFMTIFMAV